jgi:hypothetical protein
MRSFTLVTPGADHATRSASERSSQERAGRPTRIDMLALACLAGRPRRPRALSIDIQRKFSRWDLATPPEVAEPR